MMSRACGGDIRKQALDAADATAIVWILKEHQAEISAGDLCRKHGISDATFYT